MGAAACILLMVVLHAWFSPAPPPPTAVEPRTSVPLPVPRARDAAAPGMATEPSRTASDPTGSPEVGIDQAAVHAPAEQVLEVDTDVFHVVLTNRGGRARSWQLKAFEAERGQPLELLPREATPVIPLGFDLDDPKLTQQLDAALYRVDRQVSGDSQTLTFEWADGLGLRAVKTLEFRARDYRVGIHVEVVDRGRRLPVRVTWGPGFEAQEPGKGRRSFHYAHQVVRNLGGTVVRSPLKDLDGAVSEDPDGPLHWAGLEDQYFAALILPDGGEGGLRFWPVQPKTRQDAAADSSSPDSLPVVAVAVPPGGAQLFVGPKNYELLHGLGNQLESVIWFSSNGLLYFLAKHLFVALLWIHHHLVPNFGVAIMLATAGLRLLLFPLNQYSMVSMRKAGMQMQRLQPKINAIKAKYRKNKDTQARGRMNEEIMALYRREGVNPVSSMSGCVPILIQFPILIAFYNVFTVAAELRGAPFFGWIQDLSLKDPFYVTPVLMGITMFLQQRMSLSKGMDPMQQRMMLFMPLIFTVMFLNLPSGLILYWLVNNILGIGQQWLVNRHMVRLEAAEQKA